MFCCCYESSARIFRLAGKKKRKNRFRKNARLVVSLVRTIIVTFNSPSRDDQKRNLPQGPRAVSHTRCRPLRDGATEYRMPNVRRRATLVFLSPSPPIVNRWPPAGPFSGRRSRNATSRGFRLLWLVVVVAAVFIICPFAQASMPNASTTVHA